jgi:hypothetical protein
MHSYCLGVVSDLLHAWTSPENENEAFYISPQDVERIDKRISKIKVPHSDKSRLPRSLLEINDWKAYEFQSFLLHYGCIVLRGKFIFQDSIKVNIRHTVGLLFEAF